MRVLLLMLALLAASLVYSQPRSAVVYNANPSAPATASGNVTCSQKNVGSGELTFKNTSDRNIVQLEAIAVVKCTRGPGRLVRYHHSGLFFQAHGLASGESITKTLPEAGEQPPGFDASAAATSPRVDVEIRFVQFEDGSTWGDSRVMGELRLRRKNIEAFLGRMALAADNSEFDSMLNATLSSFAGDPFAYTMAFKISEVRQQSDTDAARSEVRERLAVADRREASGKF